MQAQHKHLFNNVNGNTFISITTLTDVKLTGGKKNPMQGRVTKKVSNANVMVFQNKSTNAYENMVNKRLAQEGKAPFTLSDRRWGTRIPNTPFIEHTNKDGVFKEYLEVIFLSAGNVEYFLDGNPITKNKIEGLPQSKGASQGGLTNKVILRDYAFESVIGLTIDKQQYTF